MAILEQLIRDLDLNVYMDLLVRNLRLQVCSSKTITDNIVRGGSNNNNYNNIITLLVGEKIVPRNVNN